MNRITTRISGALVTLLLLPLATNAQRIDSPYRFLDHSQAVGIFVGDIAAETGRLGAGPESGLHLGVRYGIRVSGPFMLEVDAGVAPLQRTVRDTVFAADSSRADRGDADLTLITALGNLRFNATGSRTWRGLQPFALIGAGVAIDIAGENGADDQVPADARFDFGTSFAGQLGAGIEWYPSQRLSARLDARNVLWKLKAPTAFRLGQQGALIPADEWANNFVVSAGLSLHF